eukprot:gb/GECG01012437.1/.p1 GENE.gb/GECG01012437.1/~~gb/GECG01012437.1/.p1  ORF type:complete len:757 (+),score=93.72 gb/GECG01012437.1/:1-2271(+)
MGHSLIVPFFSLLLCVAHASRFRSPKIDNHSSSVFSGSTRVLDEEGGENGGDDKTGWIPEFALPLGLFGASYFLLIFGYVVKKLCLQSWHRRRKEELMKMEEEMIKKAMAEDENKAIAVENVSFGVSMKNIEPFYIFVWLAVGALAVDLVLWYRAFNEWEGPGASTAASTALGMAFGMWFHTLCMPLVVLAKVCDWRPSRVSRCCESRPRKPVDKEGRRFVVFSMDLDDYTQKFFTYVGFLFMLIETALDVISNVVDLRIFWIPSPILRYAEERALIETMRIDYHAVKMDIDYGDTYLRFCYEKLLNALTLTIWHKIMGTQYDKWLDQRMRFIGRPPEQGINHFYYHQADASCKTKSKAYCLYPCCPVCSSYWLTRETTENMVLGGARLRFRESFNLKFWTLLCIMRGCKCTQGCKDKFNEDLDSQLVFDGFMSEDEVADLLNQLKDEADSRVGAFMNPVTSAADNIRDAYGNVKGKAKQWLPRTNRTHRTDDVESTQQGNEADPEGGSGPASAFSMAKTFVGGVRNKFSPFSTQHHKEDNGVQEQSQGEALPSTTVTQSATNSSNTGSVYQTKSDQSGDAKEESPTEGTTTHQNPFATAVTGHEGQHGVSEGRHTSRESVTDGPPVPPPRGSEDSGSGSLQDTRSASAEYTSAAAQQHTEESHHHSTETVEQSPVPPPRGTHSAENSGDYEHVNQQTSPTHENATSDEPDGTTHSTSYFSQATGAVRGALNRVAPESSEESGLSRFTSRFTGARK